MLNHSLLNSSNPSPGFDGRSPESTLNDLSAAAIPSPAGTKRDTTQAEPEKSAASAIPANQAGQILFQNICLSIRKALPHWAGDAGIQFTGDKYLLTIETKHNISPRGVSQLQKELSAMTGDPVYISLVSPQARTDERSAGRPKPSSRPARNKLNNQLFLSDLEAYKPPGVHIRKMGMYDIPIARNFPKIIEIRASVPPGAEKATEKWIACLEERHSVYVNLLPEKNAAGLKIQLRNIADKDGIIRDPRRIRYLISHINSSPGLSPEKPALRARAALIKKDAPRDLRDLTADEMLTIDPPGTRDKDDAVFARRMDNGKIFVRIAYSDVTSEIRRNSPEYLRAKRAGNTIYGRFTTLPMISGDLAFEKLSLHPGKEKQAWISEFIIDTAGKILSSNFYRGRIKLAAGLTYDKAQEILKEGGSEHREMLETLSEASAFLRHRRGIKKGLIRLGSLVSSHEIIEECAIAAREICANYCASNNIPILYRVHSLPCREQRRAFQDRVKKAGVPVKSSDFTNPVRFGALLRCLRDAGETKLCSEVIQAYLMESRSETINNGHVGLKLPAYIKLSGLRDLSALENQLQLDSYFRNENILNGAELTRVKTHVNRKERAHTDNTYKLLKLESILSGLESGRCVARITGFSDSGAMAELPAAEQSSVRFKPGAVFGIPPVDGMGYRPGDLITLDIEGYDINTGRFVFRPLRSAA